MCSLKNPLLVHLAAVPHQTIQISPAVSFFFSVYSFHLSFRSLFLLVLFVFPSANLLPTSPCYLYASHSLLLSSFAAAERIIYCQQKRPQNLKSARVYTFCVQLFTPCITMRAHASIIQSAWFITSRSSGPLRKYGNYNCARLMMRTAPDKRARFMNNVRTTFENA